MMDYSEDWDEVEDPAVTQARELALMQVRHDTQAVLDNGSAMRFLCVILDELGYYGDPMRDDPHRTAYQTGLRAGGTRIVQALERVDPTAHLKLLQIAAKTRGDLLRALNGDDTND